MDISRPQEVLRALEKERERLLKLREELDRRYFGASQQDMTGELSGYDQHPADIASTTEMRELTLGLETQLALRLSQVEQAIQRVHDGTYGYCELCGRPIEPERLAVRPETPFCVADAERVAAEAERQRRAAEIPGSHQVPGPHEL